MLDVNIIRERTRKWEELTINPVNMSNGYDYEVAEAVQKMVHINRDIAAAMCTLLSTATKVDYSSYLRDREEDRVRFAAWTVVVPVSNGNSHNYALDCPALIMSDTDSCRAWRMNTRSTGNSLPRAQSGYRPATDEEIDMCVRSYNAWVKETM